MSPTHFTRSFLPLAIAVALLVVRATADTGLSGGKASGLHVPKARLCAAHASQEKTSVAELTSRGDFALRAGQYAEAITVFEEALKSNSNAGAIWGRLAFLYIKEGRSLEAVGAFKKAKLLGDANGGVVTRTGVVGPMFP
jgi:Flp pilus assembly protein TadD